MLSRPDPVSEPAPLPAPREGNHLLDVSALWDDASQRYLGAKHAWLQAAGWRHTIVAPQGHGRGVVSCPSVPAPWSGGRRVVADAGRAQRLIERAEPDLIEVADAGVLGWAALAAARRLRVPVVACCLYELPTALGGWFGQHTRSGHLARWVERSTGAYLRRFYAHFDEVLAPSESTVRVLRGFGVSNVRLQSLGVDSALFTPRLREPAWRWQLERLIGAAPGSTLLLYAGRFEADKNLPLLVEAVRQLGPRCLLLAVGSGPLPPTGAQVRVLAPQPDHRLARLMANVDGFVHAGDRETFGLAVLEAMACGTPVITSGYGALPELAEGAGLVVRSRDPADWAAALATLLEDGAPQRWAAQGRTRAIARDWSVVMTEWEARYLTLLLQREGQTLPEFAAADQRALA
ncbi:glycosyltransferase [Aquincola sp. S2]|uniref:Glycosyltransferase n=1 Tax=Pseudaquabacterium terrae TaxID=2732868 RepID=A0ABX2ETT0_9BURK|nr:glycosyltransferase [Aquabacterium terrae]NRF71829.1 glycosyltransferase [Aquabacterium terrae]